MNASWNKFSLCVSIFFLTVCVSVLDAQGDKETPTEKIRRILDQPITLSFTGQDYQDIANHLKDKTGVNFVLDQIVAQMLPFQAGNLAPIPGGVPAAPALELKVNNAKLSEAVQRVLNPSGLTYVIADNSVVFTTDDQAAARVFGQRINVKVEEVPLQKVLKDLVRNSGFNLVIDPRVSEETKNRVTLRLDNTALETSVRLLAELAGLKAVRMDNVLFITSEARADKMRQENPTPPLNPNNRMWPGVFGGAGFGAAPAIGIAQPIRVQVNPALPQPMVEQK